LLPEAPPRALILGLAGPVLTEAEQAFFAETRPLGFILFKRNCESRAQVKALTASLRQALGRPDAPILIDQEGGRVARLSAPEWPLFPSGAAIGALWRNDADRALEAAWRSARLIAFELKSIGVDVDCAPVLDVPVPGSDRVIGDRAYADDPERVAALGRAFALGLLDGGVLPVIKHIPGHGRGTVDSHLALPIVEAPLAALETRDFLPFRALADMPLGMTAHIQFSAIDNVESVTCSSKLVQDIIRKAIGFDGLLMTDDLSMQALGGTLHERADKSLLAGCDVLLHCNGRMEEMREVAAAAPPLSDEARRRWLLAAARRRQPAPFDAASCRAALDRLLAA